MEWGKRLFVPTRHFVLKNTHRNVPFNRKRGFREEEVNLLKWKIRTRNKWTTCFNINDFLHEYLTELIRTIALFFSLFFFVSFLSFFFFSVFLVQNIYHYSGSIVFQDEWSRKITKQIQGKSTNWSKKIFSLTNE